MGTHSKTSIEGSIRLFEEEFANWLGVRFVVGTASGTFALFAALKAVGVKPGDEVIVPAYDWFSAAAAVLHCGAIPVFADVDELSYTIDPNSVKKLISEKTKAIIATHLYGHPADIKQLRYFCQECNLYLIEDAAQAIGAIYEGRRVGSLGDIACFSFGQGKILSCGEGGAIATNREDLYERILDFSQHPFRQRLAGYWGNPFSLKCCINPLGAHHLIEQMAGNLQDEITKRRIAFENLNDVLKETGVLYPVFEKEGCVHSCHRFAPRIAVPYRLYQTYNNLRNKGEKIKSRLSALSIAVSWGPIREPIPKLLLQAIKEKKISFHPYLKKVKEKIRTAEIPVSNFLCYSVMVLDWEIGLCPGQLEVLRKGLSEINL